MRLPMLLCGAQVVVDIEYNSSTATRASGLTGNTDWRGEGYLVTTNKLVSPGLS